ncbi:hypothetical protein Q7P37_003271 [Cladosporium fusiforme]
MTTRKNPSNPIPKPARGIAKLATLAFHFATSFLTPISPALRARNAAVADRLLRPGARVLPADSALRPASAKRGASPRTPSLLVTTRASNARHVRQRKLNTKQPLRIIKEDEIEELPEDEAQRNIPQFETGVEKAEEIEFHLQQVIHSASTAALGEKTQQSFIPTPDAVKAKGVEYDKLYPSVFSSPATYIRFSSTVEESVGVPYCMDDQDVAILAKLNEGKDVSGNSRKDKLSNCSEDTFEEVMSFFEETSQRLQPFADIDKSPVPSFDEMERNIDENLSLEAQKWLKLIYPHWMLRKDSKAIMPSIKLRLLDNTSDADDADPYVCFRRREVRQTRKTRGRDAQIVEKLKKLRLELETSRQLVQMVNQREQLNKQNLETSRKVFEQRASLKKVKQERGIIGEKGEDEELLVNQRVCLPFLTIMGDHFTDDSQPAPKPKARQSNADARAPTIKIPGQQRPSVDRQATENELPSLEEQLRETFEMLEKTVDTKKQQHLNWNKGWEDKTWLPITPPAESTEERPKWGFLPSPQGASYPTPPPTLPSEGSQKDGDTEMPDASAPPSPPQEQPVRAGASPEPEFIIRSMPGAWPRETSPFNQPVKRDAAPACRLRRGRGGIMHLEARKQRQPGLCQLVVTDSDDSDEEMDDWFAVSDAKIFDYRTALNSSVRRPDTGNRQSLSGGGASQGTPVQPQLQRVASTTGNAG